MILWINGAFGAGKTQAAYEIHRRLPGSWVYDPEQAGFFIRKNLPPGLEEADFQDYPMWREINLSMLDYLAARRDGVVIVPMTITNRAYHDQLIGGLSRRHKVVHVILRASRETILRRLASRLEGRNSWAAGQIGRCLRAFDGEIPGRSIFTDGLGISQVAERIAAEAGLSLTPPRRGRLGRRLERLAVMIRHIR